MRIAHLSDLHILHLDDIRFWRYFGKRMTGGLNLLLRRARSHSKQTVIDAFAQIAAEGVDHIVITGDLSNLAFESEFAEARAVITDHAGDGDAVSIIPGNHDYYTYNSVRSGRFEAYFGPWMQTELPGLTGAGHYPWVKLLSDQVALVGVNTCIPSPPLFAVGRVGKAQRRRLADILAHPEVQRRFVVVALHHHLVPPTFTSRKRELFRQLVDARKVFEVVADGDVDLVIHGHNHQYGLTTHARLQNELPFYISEAGSTSASSDKAPHFGPKYNIYDIRCDKGAAPSLERITTRLFDARAGQFVTWKEISPDQA